MEKLLLVSIVGAKNFGNRLQQYALQRKIEELGFEVDLIARIDPPAKWIAKRLRDMLYRISGNKLYRARKLREKRFLERSDLFYKNLFYVPESQVFRRDWSAYRFAVVGSDQIWRSPKPYSYLQFIEASKRVSYAPSFGFSAFPEKDVDAFRRGLMGIRALSCREQEGCDLIAELTGRKAEKVLDPTLLLTADDWVGIEKKPDFAVPERYMLVNMLGTLPPEYEGEIRRICRERKLQILNISDCTDPLHYAISPDEFIWLVHSADTVCTDSFHTAAFSILFEKNLRVFRRRQERFQDMFGRLHDLLEPLGLLHVVYGDGDDLSTGLSREAKAYLAAEREKSLRYLRESLWQTDKIRGAS